MYFIEYNNLKVKNSTVTVGYDVDVTNIIRIHAVMTKLLRGQSNQWY